MEKTISGLTKAVKSFVEDYNAVVEQAGNSDTENILRNAMWMTGITDSTEYACKGRNHHRKGK